MHGYLCIALSRGLCVASCVSIVSDSSENTGMILLLIGLALNRV